jgi:hypothetical protein
MFVEVGPVRQSPLNKSSSPISSPSRLFNSAGDSVTESKYLSFNLPSRETGGANRLFQAARVTIFSKSEL